MNDLGKGIAWAGFWIGLGLLGSDFVQWLVRGLP